MKFYKIYCTVPEIVSPTLIIKIFDIIVEEVKISKFSKSQNSPMYGSQDIPTLSKILIVNCTQLAVEILEKCNRESVFDCEIYANFHFKFHLLGSSTIISKNLIIRFGLTISGTVYEIISNESSKKYYHCFNSPKV